jgi:hypothetical protein
MNPVKKPKAFKVINMEHLITEMIDLTSKGFPLLEDIKALGFKLEK